MNTPPPPLLSPPSNPPKRCLSCSSAVPEHPRIRELEAQVQLLSEKLSSTNAKLMAYESAGFTPPTSSASSSAPPFPPDRAPSPANRFSAFLFPGSASAIRKAPGAPPSPPPDCSPAELAKERRLRLKAEEQLQQVTAELEDLSASLFQEANMMVAEERRARSKLEERVAALEKRDIEKRERLGVLERAVDRISRVRVILGYVAAGEER